MLLLKVCNEPSIHTLFINLSSTIHTLRLLELKIIISSHIIPTSNRKHFISVQFNHCITFIMLQRNTLRIQSNKQSLSMDQKNLLNSLLFIGYCSYIWVYYIKTKDRKSNWVWWIYNNSPHISLNYIYSLPCYFRVFISILEDDLGEWLNVSAYRCIFANGSYHIFSSYN